MALLCPMAEAGMNYFLKAVKKLEDGIPDARSKVRYAFKELVKQTTSFALLLENNEKDGLSEPRLCTLRGQSMGLHLIIVEILAGLRNVKLGEEIRSTYLFQLVPQALVDANSLLMDILKLQQPNDTFNGIRRQCRKGVGSIETVFQNTVRELHRQYSDLRVAIKKLQDVYPADENVLEYLDIVQTVWDGHIFALLHIPAYGNMKLRLRPLTLTL